MEEINTEQIYDPTCKEEKNTKLTELGVTLIALVITIIVLLILAAISITTLFGNNGVITKAREASSKTTQEKGREEINLAISQMELDEQRVVTLDFIKDNIAKYLKGIESVEEVTEGLAITYKGYVYILDGNLQIIDAYLATELRVVLQQGEVTYNEETGKASVPVVAELRGENPSGLTIASIQIKDGDLILGASATFEVTESGTYEITIKLSPDEQTFTRNITVKIPNTVIADGKWNGKVNAPKLLDGMSAVYWNSEGREIYQEDSDFKAKDWYDYTAKKWANAVTRNSDEKITGYWVWIPRYAYQISTLYHTASANGGNINIKFLKNKTNEAADGTTTWDNVSGLNKWNIHPAFRDGSATGYANGEWKSELEGFWVAKFAAGYAKGNNGVERKDSGLKYTGTVASANLYGNIISETASPGNGTEIYYPVFLPKTYAYNNINIGDIYRLTRSLTQSENPYGLNNAGENGADSHMMKNSEWGAVAYLTQSTYGINENIYKNNVSLNNTPATICAVTGFAGLETDTATNITTITILNDIIDANVANAFAWNTENGQKASSTGNMYGIYDLSGCVVEYVTAYIENTNGETKRTNNGSALINEINKWYKTIYAHDTSNDSRFNNYKKNSAIYGDAMYETSLVNAEADTSKSWYSDNSSFPNSTTPFLLRRW